MSPSTPSSKDGHSKRSPQNPNGGEPPTSLIGLTNVVLRDRRLIAFFGAVGILAGVLTTWLADGGYTAQSTFIPQVGTSSQTSGLAGLAAQFGVRVPVSSSGSSLELYDELLKSREILRRAVLTSYQVPVRGDSTATRTATLVELYGEDGDQERRTSQAISRLAADVGTSYDVPSGTVRLGVTAPYRTLAVQINQRILELVDEFNRERRQRQAAEERAFIEARLAETQRDLEAAEGELEQFLDANRRVDNAPDLRFEAARLERRVAWRQELLSSLTQSFEQARLEEVRNLPLITVIDHPRNWVFASGPNLVVNLLVGLLAGLALGVVVAFFRKYLDDSRDRSEYEELVALSRATLVDLSASRLRRRLSSTGRRD